MAADDVHPLLRQELHDVIVNLLDRGILEEIEAGIRFMAKKNISHAGITELFEAVRLAHVRIATKENTE